MKQIGISLTLYQHDNDDQIFFRTVSPTSIGRTRVTNPTFMSKTLNADLYNRELWYNLLLPYVKSSKIWVCPTDDLPTLSPDESGATTILRSYIVSAAIEDLSASQIPSSAETLVVTEKWSGKADTWIDQMDGDMLPQKANAMQMNSPASRHSGGMNGAFFDGHAKRITPGQLWTSADLSGCRLIHLVPAPTQNLNAAGSSTGLCDSTMSVCGRGSAESYSNRFTGTDPNFCNANSIQAQFTSGL